MALIEESKLSRKERDLSGAFAGTKARLDGFKAVRRPSALVIDLLLRTNNFFATGDVGLIAVGIKDGAKALSPKIDGKENPVYNPSLVVLTVPQIAEVVVLLTCSEDELDACDDDIKYLRKLARDVLKDKTSLQMVELLPAISEEFDKINLSSATAPDDGEGETRSLINTKKKRSRTG